MPKVMANGTGINYEVTGQGTPVLFIHGGFGGPSTTVVPQVSRVASIFPSDRVQTITYDRRSAGQSEYDLTHYRLPDLAADARALLEHLGINRSVIIGDSMGGMVAQQYALAYPEHTQALALVETGANLMGNTEFGPMLKKQLEQATSAGDRPFFESRLDSVRNPSPMSMGPRPPEAQQAFNARHDSVLAALPGISDDDLFNYSIGSLRNTAAFIGFDFSSRLGELKMPTCVIHGNADPTVPYEQGLALHNGIPQSEFFKVEGAGHIVLDFPEAEEALRDWVLRVIE